jgi:hypothetical protein
MIPNLPLPLQGEASDQRSMLGNPLGEAGHAAKKYGLKHACIKSFGLKHYHCVASAALLHCLPPALADTCCCTQHLGMCAEVWVVQGNNQSLQQVVCCFLQRQGHKKQQQHEQE